MQTIADDSATLGPTEGEARCRLGLLIGGVYRKWRRQIDYGLKDLGLTDAARMPLLELYAHGQRMRQKDLALALQLDSSSLVRVLAQLRSAQLVDWSCEPGDRRTKCIALTAKGQCAAAQLLQKTLAIEQAILGQLTADELATTRIALYKISQQFDAM